MDHEVLQSGTVRVEVAKVLRVAVSQSGGVDYPSVVVDGGIAIAYLVLAVEVDIAYAEVMGTLTPCRVAIRVGSVYGVAAVVDGCLVYEVRSIEFQCVFARGCRQPFCLQL